MNEHQCQRIVPDRPAGRVVVARMDIAPQEKFPRKSPRKLYESRTIVMVGKGIERNEGGSCQVRDFGRVNASVLRKLR